MKTICTDKVQNLRRRDEDVATTAALADASEVTICMMNSGGLFAGFLAGALLCALLVTAVAQATSPNIAPDAEMLGDGAPVAGSTVAATTWWPDVKPPVIRLLGDAEVYIECGANYTDAGATAYDDWDGDVTDAIVVGGNIIDHLVPGTYRITYNVSDAAANAAAEVTRAVHVVDTDGPQVLLAGEDIVYLNVDDDYAEAGIASVIDLCDSVELLEDTLEITVLFILSGAQLYSTDQLCEGQRLTIKEMNDDDPVSAIFNIYGDADLSEDPEARNPFNASEGDWVLEYIIHDVMDSADNPSEPAERRILVGNSATVPDLEGLTEAAARTAIESAPGLLQVWEEKILRPLAETPNIYGVFYQSPDALADVPLGARVRFSTWTPRVIGLPEGEANSYIGAAEYFVQPFYSWREDYNQGIVYSQNPPEIDVNKNVFVPILVSWGKQPSAIFVYPFSPMTAQCVQGQLWPDIDPLAMVQSGDGTVLIDDLAASELEYWDNGDWVELDMATEPLVVGEYRATYTYEYGLPGDPLAPLAPVERLITIRDDVPPSVSVTGDDPGAWDESLGGYVYTVTAGAYGTWAAFADDLGLVATAADACNGAYDSSGNPGMFRVYVLQSEDGVNITPVGLFELDATAEWLNTPIAPPGGYGAYYIGYDDFGNSDSERDGEGVGTFRVIIVDD